MERNCERTGRPFTISEFEREYCRARELPLPTLAPRCRQQDLLVWRNRPFLRSTSCAATGKKILSMYPPELGFPVYDTEYYRSDAWDARAFGRDYDFKRTFFEQFAELYRAVPKQNLAISRETMENSDYTNGITGAKNCYLLFASSFNEDCYFSYWVVRCRSMVDCLYCFDCELCYDSLDLRECYDVRYSEHCSQCSESAFLSQCTSCKNCFGCVNLAHAEHCFFNQPLSRDEYRRRIAELDLGSRAVVNRMQAELRRSVEQHALRSFFGKSNENSTGNFISNNKNCHDSFFISNCEDVEHSLLLDKSKSAVVHIAYGNGSELVYNSITVGDSAYDVRFSSECWNSTELEYCIGCTQGVSRCFGCAGLRGASYCVLNKEYSRAEYGALVERIRAQMRETGEFGRFFPTALAPFYYNESDAMQYFPLSEEEAVAQGYRWSHEEHLPGAAASVVPDHVRDAADDVLQSTFACSTTGRPFRVMKQELEFYRRQTIPLPVSAPLERIKSRLGFFRIGEVQRRKCDGCAGLIDTVQAEAGNRPVLCERCFQVEVYGGATGG